MCEEIDDQSANHRCSTFQTNVVIVVIYPVSFKELQTNVDLFASGYWKCYS